MANTRRQFDPEFRAGAVRIVTETGKSVAQVARDLGISPYTLHNWVQTDRRQTQDQGPLVEDERGAGPPTGRESTVGQGKGGVGDGA